MMKRVLVCGGRKWMNHDLVSKVLGDIKPTIIIEGGADGADRCARLWADWYDIPRATFNAEWEKYGAHAGPKRNARMLAEGKPDLVVAFPGGRGTDDMKRKARAAGVPVMEIKEPNDE